MVGQKLKIEVTRTSEENKCASLEFTTAVGFNEFENDLDRIPNPNPWPMTFCCADAAGQAGSECLLHYGMLTVGFDPNPNSNSQGPHLCPRANKVLLPDPHPSIGGRRRQRQIQRWGTLRKKELFAQVQRKAGLVMPSSLAPFVLFLYNFSLGSRQKEPLEILSYNEPR